MGTKHDRLTEQELATYQPHPAVLAGIEQLTRELALPREEIRLLDWGCGRGRSVAKLREMGFAAFGVEIDQRTLQNGYPLFAGRGLDPQALLLHPAQLQQLPAGSFHCIFSEQLLEHLADLQLIATEAARLTRPGGTGIHCLPASRQWQEEHIQMPWVHWLPKNRLRWGAIALLLGLGYGPPRPWPELRDKGFWGQAEGYYRYLNEWTYYRDLDDLPRPFRDAGFTAEIELSINAPAPRWLPARLRRNGYPDGRVVLWLRRDAEAAVGA